MPGLYSAVAPGHQRQKVLHPHLLLVTRWSTPAVLLNDGEVHVSDTQRTRFERADPILRVEDMAAAVQYYVEVLGFEAASWGDDRFTCVSRDGAAIYLCRGDQGHTGSWAWVGVEDAEALHEELK